MLHRLRSLDYNLELINVLSLVLYSRTSTQKIHLLNLILSFIYKFKFLSSSSSFSVLCVTGLLNEL